MKSRYLDIRDQIKDGDLIGVKRKDGFLPNMIRLVSRKPYTHVAIAIWQDKRLYAAGMLGCGNVLIPLSQYQGINFDIYPNPKKSESNEEEARQSITDMMGVHIPYAFVDLVFTAIREWFKLDLGHSNKRLYLSLIHI